MSLTGFPCERQLDAMDCGPACLKSVARHYGKYYSLPYLRELCGTSREGVSLMALGNAAEEIGFKSLAVRCSLEEMHEKVQLPAIVHWDNCHFVVVFSINKNKISRNGQLTVSVADPAKGVVKLSSNRFNEHWLPQDGGSEKGVLLVLEPSVGFRSRGQEKGNGEPRGVKRLLSYFLPYTRNFWTLAVLMTIVTCLQAALPFIAKSVIDIGIYTQDLKFISIVLTINIAIYLVITLCNAVRDWILQHLTSRINVTLISDYLIKLMKLPVTFFENKMAGDILQRANDHERIRTFIMGNSLNLVFSIFTFVIFSVVLFIYDFKIFAIFFIGTLVYLVWVLGFLRLRKSLDWDYFELTSKNQSYWIEIIESMQDIKLNNYEKIKRWNWEVIQAKIYKLNMRTLSVNNFQTQGAFLIDNVKNLLITFYCAIAVINGDISFGVMISTQFIMGMLNAPIHQFIQFVIAFQFAKLSYQRLNEIHELENEYSTTTANNLLLLSNRDIILRNVVFRYSPTAIPVIRGLTITIPQNKITAIVGDSGSGKSTLLKLITCLYRPSMGEIYIGDTNLNNINLRQWRDRCGVVMQDGKIFNDTILNNIVLDAENIDYPRLQLVLEAANISSEIQSLPQGYHTKMGEQGRGLSGGQRQRILIARALYRNPDYLFLDEATNALDTINEAKIVDSLDKIFNDKTVVVIAHRLSTIKKAHQIVVLREGIVVEVGSHADLLERKGAYHALTQSQL